MSDAGERIVRMLAVARGLEDDGQYNVAKLLRAAAFGEGAHASLVHPRLGEGLEDALDSVVAELDPGIHGQALIATLRNAAKAVRADGWPTLVDAPPVSVCRSCGQSQLGAEPGRCGGCGARPVTLQSIPTVFYTLPISADDVLETLATSGEEDIVCLTNIDEQTADQGVWPAHAILEHLLGSEAVFMARIERVLTEDHPLLGSINPEDISDDHAGAPTMATMLAAFADRRAVSLARLRGVSRDGWQRAGHHPEFGRMTTLDLAAYLTRHEQMHLPELEARRTGL